MANDLKGRENPLAGGFPVTFGMGETAGAWLFDLHCREQQPFLSPGNERLKGHEFRYSTVLQWDGRAEDLALKVERGTGFMDGRNGLVKNNVLALYTHVLAQGTPEWAAGIVGGAKRYMER